MGARLSSMISTSQSSLIHPPHLQHPLPSHATVASFIASLLPQPSKPTDVSFHYHSPRSSGALISTSHVVLSITPTPGFYAALSQSSTPRPSANPLGFLHRPWNLMRSEIPKRSTVLASHTGFDEVLTVGWNTALAAWLRLDVTKAVCLQGYKGDAERKIGLLAGFVGEITAVRKDEVVEGILREFGDQCYDVSNIEESGQIYDYTGEVIGEKTARVAEQHNLIDQSIAAVAIMNAFGADEVQRVLDAAATAGLLSQGGRILYLTGQPRTPGLEAAKQAAMMVVCVGHRAAEEWGLRYLASSIRVEFPGLEVIEVYEEEVKTQRTRITDVPGQNAVQQ